MLTQIKSDLTFYSVKPPNNFVKFLNSKLIGPKLELVKKKEAGARVKMKYTFSGRMNKAVNNANRQITRKKVN